MIRLNKPSIYYCLLLLYTLSLNFRIGSSEEVPCQLSILIPFHDEYVLYFRTNLLPVAIFLTVSACNHSYSRIIAADNKSTVISSEDSHRDGLTLLASALLAIHDFNNRTSSFAPDALKGIEEDCTIKFPLPKIIGKKHWCRPTSFTFPN